MYARLLAVALLASALLHAQPTAAASAGVPSVTDPRYFVGANMPWYNWGSDFGGGTNNGVSSAAEYKALATGFGQLKSAGVHTVRWWVFEGDASQITRDANGAPSGLNPSIYADFDAALALADQYDLSYDFVLFSAPTAVPTKWMTDSGQRQQLANVLAPLFDHYKNNPRILAWELINEPEWDIWNLKIKQEDVQATVQLLASTVHQHTSTAVTVGSANLEGVLMWTGVGLDFYAPHWYDPMDSGLACARCTDAPTINSMYSLGGVPIVLGEFYASPTVDALQRFKDFQVKGYAGAWAWSLFSDRTADKFPIDLNAVKTFTSSPAAPLPTPTVKPDASNAQLRANWVSPTYAQAGEVVTINQDVTADTDTHALLDFEIFDAGGNKVWQDALDNQALPGKTTSSFTVEFPVPSTLPPGEYTVKTGLFSPGWGTMFAWSDFAGGFKVDATASAPPPPSSPTTQDNSNPDDTSPDGDASSSIS